MGHERRRRPLRTLVERHHAFVGARCGGWGCASDVDDAVQKVYLVASRKLETIEPTKDRAFLLGIAARIAANERRAQRRAREDVEPSTVERTTTSAPGPDDPRAGARAVLDELLTRCRSS